MRFDQTVTRMRKLLVERGVALIPDKPNASGYEGDGADAQAAWEVFCAVAVEPAYDSVVAWDEPQDVSAAGFMFEATFSAGWPKNPHNPNSRDMPEHYELMFTRQFAIGDAGDMEGLNLTIFIPAADELRSLSGDSFGGAVGSDSDPAATLAWLREVELLDAFKIPMTEHRADRFQFVIDAIG